MSHKALYVLVKKGDNKTKMIGSGLVESEENTDFTFHRNGWHFIIYKCFIYIWVYVCVCARVYLNIFMLTPSHFVLARRQTLTGINIFEKRGPQRETIHGLHGVR